MKKIKINNTEYHICDLWGAEVKVKYNLIETTNETGYIVDIDNEHINISFDKNLIYRFSIYLSDYLEIIKLNAKFTIWNSQTYKITRKIIWEIEEFNDIANDIFENFLSDFGCYKGLIQEISQDDEEDYPENCTFYYTVKGIKLAEKMLERLYKLAEKYFEEADMDYFDVSSHLYQEN